MTHVQFFFAYYEIEHREQQVTLDLIDDIYARTDLTAVPRALESPRRGVDLALQVRDGHNGVYLIRGRMGGLPDDYGLVLMHNGELLAAVVSNGSLLQNAHASDAVCNEINARQRLQERKETG